MKNEKEQRCRGLAQDFSSREWPSALFFFFEILVFDPWSLTVLPEGDERRALLFRSTGPVGGQDQGEGSGMRWRIVVKSAPVSD